MGANPMLPARESAMPCSTTTQFPFDLEGLSHHARRVDWSAATMETSVAFGGVCPSLRGTCSVAMQKTAPVRKKQREPPAITAALVAQMDLGDTDSLVLADAALD